MHRSLTLILSFLLSVSLTGCGREAVLPRPGPEESPPARQTEVAGPISTDSAQNAAIDWDSRSFSYTTQELPAQVDGHAIYGEIYIPDGSESPMPAMTDAAHPEEIRGMMLLYPAFCIPDNARAQFTTLENVPEQVSFFSWLTVGRRYVEDVWDHDVYADIAAYEKDILILHGGRNGIVDLSYSQKAIEAYPAAELKVIEGAGHGFSGSDLDLAVSYLLEYLGDRLD